MNIFKFKKTPEDLSRSEWVKLIDETIIGKNSFRDREMLKENLLDGRTYEWIAEKYNLSSRQVARIIPKAKKKLYKKI